MDKIKVIEATNPDGSITEYVIIDRGNDEYTSMPKSAYDELKANEATVI